MYLMYLSNAWMMVFFYSELAAIGVGALLHRLDGSAGNRIGVRLYAFVAGFCITGLVDNIPRLALSQSARHRYERANYVLDDTARRLMRIARFNDATLVLQLAVGLFFAWRFS